ncbi:unnamed protein product [Closterium sp. NIES-54]
MQQHQTQQHQHQTQQHQHQSGMQQQQPSATPTTMAALLAQAPPPANAAPNAYAAANLPHDMQQQQQQQQWISTPNNSPTSATFGSLLRTPVAPATADATYPGQWQYSPPLVHPYAPFPPANPSHMWAPPAPANVTHGEILWASNPGSQSIPDPCTHRADEYDFTRCDSNDVGALPDYVSPQALNEQQPHSTGPGTKSPATPLAVASAIPPTPVIPSIPTGGDDVGPMDEPDDGSDEDALDILAPRAAGVPVSREEFDSMSALVRSLQRENLELKNQVETLRQVPSSSTRPSSDSETPRYLITQQAVGAAIAVAYKTKVPLSQDIVAPEFHEFSQTLATAMTSVPPLPHGLTSRFLASAVHYPGRHGVGDGLHDDSTEVEPAARVPVRLRQAGVHGSNAISKFLSVFKPVTGSFTLLTWHMNKQGIPFAGDEFVRGIIASFSRNGHCTIVLLLKHIAFWLCGVETKINETCMQPSYKDNRAAVDGYYIKVRDWVRACIACRNAERGPWWDATHNAWKFAGGQSCVFVSNDGVEDW